MAVVLLHLLYTQYFKIKSMISKNNKTEPIKTVLIITVGMLIIYLISKWKWSINVSILVGILGLLSNYFAEKIDFLWMKLSWLLSLIIPNILLAIIFYLFLTPIALLSRVFGEKNQLTLKNTNQSLFKDKNKQYDKLIFEKPW